MHLLVDSTGLKICGEGEWKVKKHGAEYRRAWRKVYLAINAETLDIRAVEMTDHRQGDAAQAEELLSQLDPAELLASVSGDGAYDTRGFYRTVCSRGAAVIVPPRRNGKPWKDRAESAQARNATLLAILAGGYGKSGAVTTGEARSRPPWDVSNCWVNDWLPAGRNDRSPRYMCVTQF